MVLFSNVAWAEILRHTISIASIPQLRKHYLPLDDYCNLVMRATVTEAATLSLQKIVHMPLDPSVLFWTARTKQVYARSSYSAINSILSFEQVHTYMLHQVTRQIFWFSQLLGKSIQSESQLRAKISPYVTAETGIKIFARVMLSGGKTIISTKGEICMRYCSKWELNAVLYQRQKE
jgi:hypothetical protein